LERSHKPELNIKSKPVITKDHALIGEDVIVMKGVTIGEESVIGIGSVVTKDVPAGEIWAGNQPDLSIKFLGMDDILALSFFESLFWSDTPITHLRT
jgi:tetrahydrodipicolinate N-succinyltransferase